MIFEETQRWGGDWETLKSAAVVCKAWSTPARRV